MHKLIDIRISIYIIMNSVLVIVLVRIYIARINGREIFKLKANYNINFDRIEFSKHALFLHSEEILDVSDINFT